MTMQYLSNAFGREENPSCFIFVCRENNGGCDCKSEKDPCSNKGICPRLDVCPTKICAIKAELQNTGGF